MQREAPRTLLSAGLPYQQGICESDYEVIAVENGSNRPLSAATRRALPVGVRIVDMPEPQPSPVFAMNWAARNVARADTVLFAIDGARIFSDRLYAEMLAAHALVEDAFVYTLGWHLGPKVQMISTGEGYNEEVEDRLIASSGWPKKADALYEVSVYAGSSQAGVFAPVAESNAFSVRRDLLDRIGGYDERFLSPGGGLSNLELFARYATRTNARNVCLLSEGTFHQTHGGIATSGRVPWQKFQDEHTEIFTRPYELPVYERLYYGSVRPKAARFLHAAIDH